MHDNKASLMNFEKNLASYAAKATETRGRAFKEKEHPYRTPYQRDRDRIIHSTAFRRLEYKTQVFVNHEGDYYRTRLTHTIEVAQIARTIARRLSLNEDLAESIALAHDLGHTPFGHSGEKTLNEIMKAHGRGFDHNVQGLRVVDYLEQRYPDFDGLNLTYEVREGIIRHNSSYDNPPQQKEFNNDQLPTLEAQVVDVADEIAYFSHDLDDGLTSRVIYEKDLEAIDIWKEALSELTSRFKNLTHQMRRYQALRGIINMFVTDIIESSLKRIKHLKIDSLEDVRSQKERVIYFSDGVSKKRDILRDFLYDKFYMHYKVIRMSNKAKRFITELFDIYFKEPKLLPSSYKEKISGKDDDFKRVVICDYIAGMTDRYALDEYKKLFQPYERV